MNECAILTSAGSQLKAITTERKPRQIDEKTGLASNQFPRVFISFAIAFSIEYTGDAKLCNFQRPPSPCRSQLPYFSASDEVSKYLPQGEVGTLVQEQNL